MTSTTYPTIRPGRAAQSVCAPRASWIRRLAAGAGAVVVLGGLSLSLAAPAQAAATSSSQSSAAAASGSTDMSYCYAPWQPGVDYDSCPEIASKG